PWPGQILIVVEVDANNGIYPAAYAIVKAETIAFVFPSAEHRFQLNNGAYLIFQVFNRQLVDSRDQSIITCLEYIKEYLMKRIVVVQKVIAKTVGPLTPYVTAVFDAIKKLLSTLFNEMENSMGVGIPEHLVHAAYRLETWAHVYSFKINPCNGREMWPVVESTTVIIPPNYKPQVGRPPKKRKKSHDEIASESCSTSKLSRKRKAVKCSKYRNLGHNGKGCRGQGGASQVGGSSQAGARQAVDARNVSGQAGARQVADARNVSSQAGARQAVDARNVSGQAGARQAADARNVSSQAAPSTATGARNASSQVAGASQPSAAPSTTSQGPSQHSAGPRQGFQAPRPAPSSGPQRLTKKIASRQSLQKLSS
ncbi:hypothetical protein Tco_1415019, partial [Tanacetum coccineum]